MQFIDSHIHLQDDKIRNAQQIIAEMKKLGFVKAVCVSSHEQDWEKVAKIADENPEFIIPAFGIHPWYISEISSEWQHKLENLIKKYPNAWIGECGLDRLKAHQWEGQEEVFTHQINLAKKYNRTLNIHLLKAENDFYQYLPNLSSRFVLHSFSGSINFLSKCLNFGAYISLSKASLKHKIIGNIIEQTPISQILTESDFPYQSSYQDIAEVVEKITKIKKQNIKDVSNAVNHNFFKINDAKANLNF